MTTEIATTITTAIITAKDDIVSVPSSVRIISDDSCTPPKRYRLGKKIGKGASAIVYELMTEDDDDGNDNNERTTMACKVVSKREMKEKKVRTKTELMTEIGIHASLSHHPNVVRYVRHFEDSENFYIVLELCANQSLMQFVKRGKGISEDQTRAFVLQILSGVEHIHKHRIIHRDLKLGNLLLDENMHVKICDFGLAVAFLEYECERVTTICGTPNYIAPEILDCGKIGYSYEADIWSIGVIMYTLLVGKPPFETADVKCTYKRIRKNEYSFPEHVSISEEARSLISRILIPCPEARPTIEQIREDLFFNVARERHQQ